LVTIRANSPVEACAAKLVPLLAGTRTSTMPNPSVLAAALTADSGVGSLLAVHAVPADYGPVRSPRDLALADPRLLELFFLNLLDPGYYIAPRGYMALSLALTSAQLAAFAVAVQ
jgi:hypothetical protein